MVGVFLIAIGIAAQVPPSRAPAVTLVPTVPQLEIAVARKDLEGGGGSAGQASAKPFESYISANGRCGSGSSSTRPVEPDGTGWHVSGETLRRNGDMLTVKVTWERLNPASSASGKIPATVGSPTSNSAQAASHQALNGAVSRAAATTIASAGNNGSR